MIIPLPLDVFQKMSIANRPFKAYDVYQNVLQMVVWESIFFNQGAACVEMTQLWAILINGWLSNDCVFNGSSALQIRLNGVAVTL